MLSEWIVHPDQVRRIDAKLTRRAEGELGQAGLHHLRHAAIWFRAVHNGWPVLFTNRHHDLIDLWARLLARDPSLDRNWRAFVALCRRAHYQPEFLSAVGYWVRGAIDALRFVRLHITPGGSFGATQAFLCGFWDDPDNHHFGRINPRVADELAAIALACSVDSERIGRGVLPLVRALYTCEFGPGIDTDAALKKLIAKTRADLITIDGCIRHPFCASLSRIKLPLVKCEADQQRMYTSLSQTPPNLISELRGTHFPTI
jgi:hypothetical protein